MPPLRIEKAKFDFCRMRREQGKIGAERIDGGPERKGPARLDGRRHDAGARKIAPSGGSVSATDWAWPCHAIGSGSSRPGLATPLPP